MAKKSMSKNSNELINFVDTRVNQILEEKRFLSKSVATVVTVSADNKTAEVTITGYEHPFSLLNKSGEILSVGENVYVESPSKSLTGAYISERFGQARLLGSDGNYDADAVQTNLENHASNTSVHFTTEERNRLASLQNYSLPVANSTFLGGIKSGGDITVDSSGIVSVNDDSHSHVIANIDELQTVLDSKSDSDHNHDGKYANSIHNHDETYAKSIHSHDGAYLKPSDNAVSASKLQTARTISLTGDVTGSVSFDGSKNVSISATVVDDSHKHLISDVDDLWTELNNTLNKYEFYNHAGESSIHITDDERLRWNNVDFISLLETVESDDEDVLTIYDASSLSYKKIKKINLLSETSNSNYVFIKREEEFVATNGQTTFNLANGRYDINQNRIAIYINGIRQPKTAFTETNSTSFVLKGGLKSGDRVLVEYISITNVLDYIHSSTHAVGGLDPVTPAMIGLGNVDNTSDAKKNVLSATKLSTSRTITLSGDITGSASFDGSTNISIATTVSNFASNVRNVALTGLSTATNAVISATDSILTALGKLQKQITDHLTDNVRHITSTERSSWNNKLDSSANAVSATKLLVARKINGVSFDGTSDITIDTAPTQEDGNNPDKIATIGFVQNALSIGGYGDMLKSIYDKNGNGKVDNADSADKALKLATARTISLTGDVTGSVVFDGSLNVNIATTVADDSHNHIISNVDGLQTALNSKGIVPVIIQSTISANWTGSDAPFSQTITVSGVSLSDTPVICPVYDSDPAIAKKQREAWGLIGSITTNNGSISVVCYDDKPTVEIPIQIKRW